MTDEEIKDLFGQVPYFIDEKILSYEQEKDKLLFTRMRSWTFMASVNVFCVIGTQLNRYAGLSWRKFLSEGPRMNENLKKFRYNPRYYIDKPFYTRIPTMDYCIIDGKGYVMDDGNHRTCIARCFLYGQDSPFLHGVTLSEQLTDLRMMALYKFLEEKLPVYCKITPVQIEVARDDGPGWTTHHYEISMHIENGRRKGYRAVFNADELEQGLLPALNNRFTARFGPFRKLLF